MGKRRAVLGVLLCAFLLGPVLAQERKEFADYKEMRAYLGELFEQKKHAEAAALLESVLDRFPANVLANTFNLAYARTFLGDPGKVVEALEEGHRRGVFYGLWDFTAKAWDPFRDRPRFRAFLEANEARIKEAQAKAAMTMEVVTPEGYDPDKKYPLFIALHGGGESVADFRPLWTSPRLRAEFITAYVQSSQVASMRGFHWQDVALTRRDVRAAYERALGEYPIDAGRVVVGGFSSGGYASLVAAFGNIVPARGFIALCPVVPDVIGDEDIRSAQARGLRGTLLTTELDNRVDSQRAFVERLEKQGLKAVFRLTPNIGHWYPKDFEALLDEAIGFALTTGKSD
jgi:acetyl esterase/lipase